VVQLSFKVLVRVRPLIREVIFDAVRPDGLENAAEPAISARRLDNPATSHHPFEAARSYRLQPGHSTTAATSKCKAGNRGFRPREMDRQWRLKTFR